MYNWIFLMNESVRVNLFWLMSFSNGRGLLKGFADHELVPPAHREASTI